MTGGANCDSFFLFPIIFLPPLIESEIVLLHKLKLNHIQWKRHFLFIALSLCRLISHSLSATHLQKAIKSYEKFSNTFAKSKQCEVRWLRPASTKRHMKLSLSLLRLTHEWMLEISITFSRKTFSCNVSFIHPLTRLLIFCCYLLSQNAPIVALEATIRKWVKMSWFNWRVKCASGWIWALSRSRYDPKLIWILFARRKE